MGATSRAKTEKPQRTSVRKPKNRDVQAALSLNQAYDSLNTCELRIQSISSELAGILGDAIQIGIKLYHGAIHRYRIGQYYSAKLMADTVTELGSLMNRLAEEEIENILRIPRPPQLPQEERKVMAQAEDIHPDFSVLASLFRRKSEKGSKYYSDRLAHFPEVLQKASKYIKRLENLH